MRSVGHLTRLSVEAIQTEASLARSAFENREIPRDLLVRLYRHYNPTIEIDSFLDQAAELFPALNCGLASAYLQYTLDQGEIITGSYDNHRHTFLKVDALIVDITADQFGGPRIYLGPMRNPWAFIL